MPARTAPHGSVARNSLGDRVLVTAVIAVTLGVLPVAWDAPVVWQVLGPLVALVYVVRTALVVWQEIFSTDPRHLRARP
ncbi:hypothetical protein [Blastococcus capsensis]|uniref:hypothetical protein n=1 Tax=Blastococcus capsensis TaxID=1564163 RepID=UPI0025408DE9|nr:hypothetical protein [Blastococcus capsensis]MDK3257902.1 hypothetical protein [Blastococcus capsensis]